MNKLIVVGNLVSNPEFKINEKGTKIGKLRIAIDSYRENENTIFMNVMSFDTLAERCQKWLKKGSKILIDGRLCCRIIGEENKEYYYIMAQNVEFLRNIKEQEEKIGPIEMYPPEMKNNVTDNINTEKENPNKEETSA